jgi:hypothetical protein
MRFYDCINKIYEGMELKEINDHLNRKQ